LVFQNLLDRVPAKFLKLEIGRIADHQVESLLDAKHPFRIKEQAGRVLIVRVPVGQMTGGFIIQVHGHKMSGHLFPDGMIFVPKLAFGGRGAGVEHAMANFLQFRFQRFKFIIFEYFHLAIRFFDGDQRIGGDEFGFQVG